MTNGTSHPIRVGIIGAGFMGRRHAEVIGGLPELEVAVVADPFSTVLAADLGVPHYLDYHDLLEHDDVDAVIIANPNDAHVSTALAAFAAEIPCLVEKPISTSLTDVTPILAASRQGGAPILVGHHRRHHPAVKEARALIEAGELGRLVAVNGTWMTLKADAYFEAAWRAQPGAGVIMINAVHDLDILRHICGEISTVQATFSSVVRELEVADTASLSFQFDNGALGTYICSDTAASPYTWDQATTDEPAFPYNPDASCYVIAGTKASLTLPKVARHYYSGPADWNHALSLEYGTTEQGDSFTRQLRHFARVVRGAAEPLVTVEDAARTIALLDAVQQSASGGERVRVGQLPAL